MEKIVIKFKHNEIICKGNASNEHIWLACQKLNLNEVEPTNAMKAMRFVKKFIRCLKYAFSKESEPTKRKLVQITEHLPEKEVMAFDLSESWMDDEDNYAVIRAYPGEMEFV